MKSLSPKQVEIIKVLGRANPDGSFCDFDQLLERLSYKPTKDSAHFSIRALEKRGLVEKKPRESRRGQSRRILALTIAGFTELKLIRAAE